MAEMKAEDVTKDELAMLFGLSSKRIERMIEIGKLPGIRELEGPEVRASGGPKSLDHEPIITLREAIDHILPLRVQTGREPKQGNVPTWDYSEVDECIRKLTSGELKPEELSLYSADRREAIGKAKAKAETAQKPEVDERVSKLNAKLHCATAYTETLKRNNDELQSERDSLKQQILELHDKINNLADSPDDRLNEQIEEAVEARLQKERATILEQAKSQAREELRNSYTDFQDDKANFERYEQSIHEKEQELRQWEQTIDYGRRSIDREPRGRMLDAIDGLLEVVTSLRKVWERLSVPDFEEWIEHMKAARSTYEKLHRKTETETEKTNKGA